MVDREENWSMTSWAFEKMIHSCDSIEEVNNREKGRGRFLPPSITPVSIRE